MEEAAYSALHLKHHTIFLSSAIYAYTQMEYWEQFGLKELFLTQTTMSSLTYQSILGA